MYNYNQILQYDQQHCLTNGCDKSSRVYENMFNIL